MQLAVSQGSAYSALFCLKPNPMEHLQAPALSAPLELAEFQGMVYVRLLSPIATELDHLALPEAQSLACLDLGFVSDSDELLVQ